MLDAGIGHDRRVRQHALHRLQIAERRRLSGDLPRNQNRIGNRGEHRAARPVGQRPAVQTVGKFGRDIVEHGKVGAAKTVAIAHRGPGIGGPGPHVAGIAAGEDFAHKGGPGGGGKGDAAHRVPQHVDAKGQRDFAAQTPDHIAHRGGRGGIDIEFIGAVVLIAEHDGIKPGRLQRLQVGAGGADQPLQARLCIMQRRTRQGPQVDHCNHRLCVTKDPAEILHRRLSYFWG